MWSLACSPNSQQWNLLSTNVQGRLFAIIYGECVCVFISSSFWSGVSASLGKSSYHAPHHGQASHNTLKNKAQVWVKSAVVLGVSRGPSPWDREFLGFVVALPCFYKLKNILFWILIVHPSTQLAILWKIYPHNPWIPVSLGDRENPRVSKFIPPSANNTLHLNFPSQPALHSQPSLIYLAIFLVTSDYWFLSSRPLPPSPSGPLFRDLSSRQNLFLSSENLYPYPTGQKRLSFSFYFLSVLDALGHPVKRRGCWKGGLRP